MRRNIFHSVLLLFTLITGCSRNSQVICFQTVSGESKIEVIYSQPGNAMLAIGLGRNDGPPLRYFLLARSSGIVFGKLHLTVAKSPDGLRYWFWEHSGDSPNAFKGCLDIAKQSFYTDDGYIDPVGSTYPDTSFESFVGNKFPDIPANKVILFDGDINEQ
jgi:hypothetical protein